jgi:hypothetical protein
MHTDETYERDGLNYELSNEQGGFAFSGGLFMEVDIKKFLITSELLFQQFRSDLRFSSNSGSDRLQFSINTLSIPLTLGYKIFKPISVNGGFTVSYPLSAEQLVNGTMVVNASDQFVEPFFRYNFGLDVHVQRLRFGLHFSSDILSRQGGLIYDNQAFGFRYRSHQLSLSMAVSLL